ncbi:MAG: type II toxin-antitoxin system Phd/YefM family antitoxin [bacterium]
MKRVGLAEARDTLSSLVNDAAHGKQRIVIESRGRAKAVIVGLDDLERLERADAGRATAANPMLAWLEDTAKLLRRQPAITGSTLEALREVREGVVREPSSVYRRQRRPQTGRRRSGQ